MFFFLALSALPQESIFDRKISLPDQRSTLYQALNQISDSIGYFFIYDSKVLNSDKKVNVDALNQPLCQVLNSLLSDSTLSYKSIGNHILIFKKPTIKPTNTSSDINDSRETFTIRGQVFDAQSKQPLPYAAIGIVELNVGNVTNYDGVFVLKIPKKFANSTLTISHIGYKTKQIPVEILGNDKFDFYLDIEHFSIQEVIIRNIDPQTIIREAMQRISENYMDVPSYLTTFYREGVKKNNKYINYSEAVFRIYKSAYSKKIEADQIKLLKSRKIQNIDASDTLIIKLKGGLGSSLVLDIIKNPPSFLDPDFYEYYNYYKSDITNINDRSAYAIEFEQKETVFEPLLKGVVYIDMENFAVLGANFQVHPKHVKKTADLLVVKRNRKYLIRPEQVRYSVSYQQFDGKYYLSHIRGDLVFKYRKRRQVFSNNFYTFMEMATSCIENQNVKKFDRRETEKTSTVFLENNFTYDESFWLDFNHIEPEENLFEALQRISSKIELISPDK